MIFFTTRVYMTHKNISALIIILIIHFHTTALTNQLNPPQELILLDQIEKAVVSKDSTEIITLSDYDRQHLGGGYRSTEDLIFEKGLLFKAHEMHIPDDPDAVDTGIANMQRDYHLSQEDIEEIFKSAGYTYQEGREQYAIMQKINTVLDIKVRSNVVVAKKDIQIYYNNHPETVPALYTLERIVIPFAKTVSKETQYNNLIASLSLETINLYRNNTVPFTIAHADIAPEKSFIYAMNPGDISLPEKIAQGFEIFYLIEKTDEHQKPLEERQKEIIDILSREKYNQLLHDYQEQVLNSLTVIDISYNKIP